MIAAGIDIGSITAETVILQGNLILGSSIVPTGSNSRTAAERSLAAAFPGGPAPVVAIFNGPEGDVSANWRRRDRAETVEFGGMLADGIRHVLEAAGEEVTGGIAGHFGTSLLSDLATPMSGAPTLCGADGDWAFFRDAGFHEGMIQPDVDSSLIRQKGLPLRSVILLMPLLTMIWLV